MLLEVQLFLAPRMFRSQKQWSPAVWAQRSVTAGSRRGTAFARIMLFRILQLRHERYRPTTVTSQKPREGVGCKYFEKYSI